VNVTAAYATPTVPEDKELGDVMFSPGGKIVKDSVTLAVALPESMTVNCGLKEPWTPAAGVPLKTPVTRLIPSPLGSPVADHV